MPNGKIHAVIASGVAVGVSAIAVHYAEMTGPAITTGLIMGSWLELILEPDLDLGQIITESERKVLKFNRLLGRLWIFYWSFYGMSFAHRDRRTHSWPTGTLIRFIYALWLPMACSLIFMVPYLGDVLLFWLTLFIGLSLGDISHISADHLVSGIKRGRL